MKKKIEFAVKLFLFFSIIFCFAVCVVMPQYKLGYMAAFIDKLEREENISGPKIVLLGDSNVAYGVDSGKIEEMLGMPVVNMGLHGGLGQTFCMDLAKKGIRQGDIVIILPGKYDYEAKLLDGTLAWLLLESDLTLLSRVNRQDYFTLLKGYPAYLKKAITLWKNHTGNLDDPVGKDRDDLNEYGDICSVGDVNIMEDGYIRTDPFCEDINYNLMDYFNEYNRYVQEKGAVMVLASAPILEPLLINGYSTAQRRQDELAQALEFPVISDCMNYIYPPEYFYDTNFHLNDRGKEIRTMQLVEDIKTWLNNREN